MKREIFRFERCEVDVECRHVLLDGRQFPLDPLPFDLLVLLIRNRHRVVSKDELLEQVWKNRCVSVGVIASAIVRVRRATGDDHAKLIKTVHRTGYRFVGVCETSGAEPCLGQESQTMVPVSTLVSTELPLALLPFENLTGQPDLDWIKLGLMSLSANALGLQPGLSVASTPSVVAALATLTDDATAEERTRVVKHLVGARHVIHVAIRREGDGYQLAYCIDAASPADAYKHLVGRELTRLAQEMAGELQAVLLPAGMAPRPSHYSALNAFADETFARAMQAAAEQAWARAINLFRVVLDVQRDSIAVQFEYLQVLAAFGDKEEAVGVGEALLASARAAQDASFAAAVHLALGRTYLRTIDFEPAKRHLDESLRLYESRGEARDSVAVTCTLRASIAANERQFDLADEMLEKAQRHLEATGNQIERVRTVIVLAAVAVKRGNLVRSLELLREAVRVSEESRLRSYFVLASINLAHTCCQLGLLHAGVKHAQDGFTMANELGELQRLASAADELSVFYRELRRAGECARVVKELPDLTDAEPFARACESVAKFNLAACEGDHERAIDCLRGSLAYYRSAKFSIMLHHALPNLVVSQVMAGRHEEALETCAEAEALPGFADDLELQGALLYCRAMMLHARGAHANARRTLDVALEVTPMGLWRAHASIDSAWLGIEAGDLGAARKALRDLGPWLEEHPAGMAVDARLKYAAGQYEAASQIHRRSIEAIEAPVPGYYIELAARYDDAAQSSPTSPPSLALIPSLPTRM